MTAMTARERIVKEVFTLFPKRGTVVLWENRIREHEVWWGDFSIRIISTSLLLSSRAEIKVMKEAREPEPEFIHLNLNHYFSSKYVLPTLLGPRRPSLSVIPEREKWWEMVRGLVKVTALVPCQNPIKVMEEPYALNLSDKCYEAEFGAYQTKALEMEEHPLWKTMENIIVSHGVESEWWKSSEGEEIEINGEEVKRFIRSLLQKKKETEKEGVREGKEGRYDPKVRHFLMIPKSIVYRDGEGGVVHVEGSFSDPKSPKWAFGSIGYWTENLGVWESGIGGNSAKGKERHDLNSLKVVRVRSKTPPGAVHFTITRLSPWTEEWSLVMIPDEIVSKGELGNIEKIDKSRDS